MRGSDIFSSVIRDLKLGPVFGNPGSTELGMLRSIENYVLTLHDSISVGMADGRSLILRRPSIVNLHTLPGLANSMSFLYTAKANRSPVIVTAGQQDTRHAVYDPLLSGDTLSLVSDSVKFKYEVKHPQDIPIAMKRAAEIAIEPPAGPVFLSFPSDVMDYEANYSGAALEERNFDLMDESAVDEICRIINESENPAVVFGYEIDAYNAMEEAVKFADSLGCPVYGEALSSRSVFETENKHYAGELLPASTLMNLALEQHDLILFVGGGFTLYPYISSPLFPGKKVISVGFDLSHRIGESYLMNPRLFLKRASTMVKNKGSYSRKPDLTLPNLIAREKKIMGVKYVLHSAKKVFPSYTVIDESTSSSPTLRSIFGYSKDRYFTARTGQLGWGMAGALGIAMYKPETLFIVGDGSIMYLIQGLWTANRYRIPLKILVLNNGGYNILKSYGKSYYPELENAEFLTLGLDIKKVTEGFGIDTKIADKDLVELKWLKDGDQPKVLVVNVSQEIPKLFL